MAAADVRITDLANPEFPDYIREAMQAAAAHPVTLSAGAVLDAARQQTGLNDFNADDAFEERLAVIMEAMNNDADLSPMGRATNFGMCVRYAAQRLRLEDLYKRHPEINQVEIQRPIIIAGLPRSGTTHMLNLISVDKRLRSLPYWESLEPIPGPDVKLAAGEEDPRIARCREQLIMQDQIMPYFKNMHDMYPEHTHEEIELMGMDFSMMLFENFAMVPAWRDYYLSHDQTPHYRFLQRTLKALQWLRGPNRWILKSPQHMEQLVTLRTVFPDATFVLPHRDPASVAISMIYMVAYSSRMSRDPVRPQAIAEYWLDRIERMLRACVRDHAQLPGERTMDILFDDFMADDIATVERIYQLAGHPMTPDIKQAMHDYMAENPRGKYGRVVYDFKKDFGLDREALRERFRFYTQYFHVREE